jgi:hypothetical protein
MAQKYKNPGRIAFEAVIKRTDGGWAFVRFPYLMRGEGLEAVLNVASGFSLRSWLNSKHGWEPEESAG